MWMLSASVALAGPPPAVVQLQTALREVASEATPAVVRFEVDKREARCPELEELLQRHSLQDAEGEATGAATGSGFIVSESGVILTNEHVVNSAVSIEAILSNQRRVPVRVVATDPRTDVAVLQIDAPGPFPWLQMADSDEVAVGDLVVAIGNPFDFDSTVTFGIVSAMGRRGLSEREIQDYIQTDAAVNPGNSGGPLIGLDGRVVGLNTAIYAPGNEQNSGISFAIPSNMLARVRSDLENDGRVRRPWLGMAVETVGDVDVRRSVRGAEVQRVVPDGPAETAGVRRGDVIVAVNGEPTPSRSALRALIIAQEVGAQLGVDVMRGGERRTLQLVTAEERRIDSGPKTFPDDVLGWSGMTIADPTDAIRGHFGVATDRGAIVLRVDEDSPAARMGIVPGDLILQVGKAAVYDLATLRAELGDEPAIRTVTLGRGGETMYAVVPAG